MSVKLITTTSCDRCNHASSSEDRPEHGWAWINAARSDAEGPRIGATPGAGRYGDDLCPGCFEGLLAWWCGVPAPVPQPTPPAPPPPPIFNLDDRKRAIDLVVEGLRLRTQFVLQVVRDEPTAILTGEIVPGTLYAIEETAAGIVDGTLDVLGLTIPGKRRGRGPKAVTVATDTEVAS